MTLEDSATVAAEYRRVIDTENRVSAHALATRYDDEINLYAFMSALGASLTADQAELLAEWWDSRWPDADGDTWLIAQNYRHLADYLRRPPYDGEADVLGLVDEFWTAVDPDGGDRAARTAWGQENRVDIDELAAAAAHSLNQEARTAA